MLSQQGLWYGQAADGSSKSPLGKRGTPRTPSHRWVEGNCTLPPVSSTDVWAQSRQGEPGLALWGQRGSRDVGSQKEAELGAQGERPMQGQHLAHVLAGNRSPVWGMWHIHGAPDIAGRLRKGLQVGGGRGYSRGSWMSAERKEGQVGPAEAQEGKKHDGPGSPGWARMRKPRLRDVSCHAQLPRHLSPLSRPQVS